MTDLPKTNGVSIVTSKKERKEFLDFPYRHYEDDEHWIAPLKIEQKKLIDTETNPFYNNADIALFLAEQNGKTCGRIAAIVDHRYNDYHGTQTGFFGFFESIDDPSVANLLFKVVEDWLIDRGMNKILGPASPSMMDEIGILVEGFEYDPSLLMPYSKPYYDSLVKSAGFEKEMDLYSFRVNQDVVSIDRMNRAARILKQRYPELSLRQVDMDRIEEEVEIVRDIFNRAWAENWGFIPLTSEELAAVAKDFKLILDPDLAHIAEMDGEPIGFSVSLPDLNQALKHMNGRLLPFGIFKLLWYRRKINRVRTALMGVIPEYRGKGIDALLHRRTILNGRKKGIYSSDMGWVLESNPNMIRVAERLGGHREKTYRMYSKSL